MSVLIILVTYIKNFFNFVDSFEKALKKLRKVECSSELGTTEDESVRTRKRPQRFLSSSSSEDDDTYCGHKRPPPLKSNAKSEIAGILTIFFIYTLYM